MTRKNRDKETLRYIDILTKNIEDTSLFSIHDILKESQNLSKKDDHEFSKIMTSVKSFGKKEELFSSLTKENDCFKLTDRGKRFHRSNKSFEKLQKFENKTDSWFNKNWVGHFITALVLLFTVITYYDNRSLEREYESLIKQQDSLKTRLNIYKDSISKLEIKYLRRRYED